MTSPFLSAKASVHLKFVLLLLLLASLILTFPLLVRAPQDKVVYVDLSAISAGNGISWNDPFNNLQAALDDSPPGSVFWCKNGTIEELKIEKPCVIYGGFEGTEISIEERDYTVNPTVIRSLEATSDATIDGVAFSCLSEGNGFAFSNGNNPTLRNCKLIQCSSDYELLYFESCLQPSLINCLIARCEGGAKQPSPLLFFGDCRDVSVINCTIVDNKPARPDQPIVKFRDSNGEVINTILWNPNFKEIQVDTGGDIFVSYCDIGGGYPGDGNIDKHPRLTSDGRLLSTSPCRDAGSIESSPERDIQGDDRPFGPGVDIGADECTLPYAAPPTAPPFIPAPPRSLRPRPLHPRTQGETPPPTPLTPSPTPIPEATSTPTPSPTAPLIDEGFNDFHIGIRPSGWSFVNCNADSDTYTVNDNAGRDIPSLKLDATGDRVVTKNFCEPYDLSFWIKGFQVDLTSSLLVEEYYSSNWHQVTEIDHLPTAGFTAGPFGLNANSIQVQFTYFKSSGNLAFDDVIIKDLPTPTPPPTPSPSATPPTPTPSPSATVTPTPVPTATPSPSPTLTPSPTPSPTATPTASPSPTVPPPEGYRDIVINEVNFAADISPLPGKPELAYEYVELYNRGNVSVSLSGWHLKDSNAELYTFPSGEAAVTMPTGSFLLILSSAAAGSFQEDTDLSDGSGRLIAGDAWAASDLVNTGDAVQLYANSAEDSVSIADFVYYDEVNNGDGTVDAVAVSAALWSSQSAIDTLSAASCVGRAIYLIQDGESPHEASGNDLEDLDWDQYPADFGGSPGYTNPIPPSPTPSVSPTSSPTPIPTSTPTPHPAAHPLDVVINEIGWMGTAASTSDEYIELFNATTDPIILNGWTLKAADGRPEIYLSGTIPESGYFLLERSDDHTVSDIPADQLFSWGLGNPGETLRLRDGTGQLIDSVDSQGGWYAGEGSPGYNSMERIDPEIEGTYSWNWRSNDGCLANGQDANGGPLNATPKRLNSVFYPGGPAELDLDAGDGLVVLNWTAAESGKYPIEGYNVYRKSAGGSYQKITGAPVENVTFTDYTVTNGTKYYYYIKTQDTAGNESNCASDEETVTPGSPPVLGDNVIISEVMFNPTDSEKLYEWIELFNPTANGIVLDGWWITDDNGRFNFPTGVSRTIVAGAYMVLGSSASAAGGNVDVVYNNQSTTVSNIYLNNTEDTISLYNEQSELVDQVHYYGNWIREEGHSIVRKAIKKRSNFVELQNIGDHSVDLVGLKIYDGAETDSLQAYCTNQSVLQPNGYGLIVTNQFFNRYNIQTGTVLVTCGDLAIGNGLTPLDDLTLYDRDGIDVVSTFTSFPEVEGPPDDTSVERINPQTGDFEANWGLCTDPDKSTPGRKNSLTP